MVSEELSVQYKKYIFLVIHAAECGDWEFDTCDVKDEGRVIYKNKTVVTNSGGTCIAPNLCENCEDQTIS
ncbi:hypothetical protein MAR_020267 [Mya arenaria]|uniref:Uncharacterized protein n=1 Tax=Mya arenaria TaxID=6604 RepID=A0ABY7E810_MYAAR|nr:hypothetical protein MAR_020267 [Mya arenaria]